ncbi:MAG: outer membrane protein assembly factor BamA [Gammaproteobacteria bacterium]|nr:MAG: outer membrane protein assembly factor BamA [Gammaproteobacteria bacterium]
MRIRIGLVTVLAFVLVLQAAWAAGFRIEDIRVEGLQRITAGTVFNYLPVKPGDTLSDKRSAEVIRALFNTGFFKDVRLERDGNVLVVVVSERPAIAELNFSGNKSIDTDALKEGLKDVGLAEGRTFNRSVLDSIERELERQYFNQGKYGVKIKTTVTPLERNRVAIDIDVTEGETARIKGINIIGNKAFDEDDLLDEFKLSTGGWFSRFTKDDQYSRQKLAGDLETLRSFYLDRGYVNFKVKSTQVTITPDKKDIYVTINIDEGDVFTLSDIQLAGDYVGKPEDYFPLIHLRRGEPFNRKAVVESSDRISAMLSDQGYAFANVNAIPEIDNEKKTVTITYFVDPGKRVYVRRLNIKGNSRTRDEVIRREFRQMEAAWFSGEKLKLSRERAQRTGFFEKVNVETPAVPGSPDQVDVNVSVTEKPSGELLAGLGYSQADGFIFNASVAQENFLGTGKKVSLALQTSSANRRYEISYTNPYYTVDGISRGFTLSYRSTDFNNLSTADYKTDDGIVGVNFGIPLSEFNRFSFGAALHLIDFQKGSSPPPEVTAWETAEGNNYLDLELTLGWMHDSRDNALFPKEGALQRLSAEVTMPGSDLLYYKFGYKHRRYWPVFKDLVFSLNGEVAYGAAYGGTSQLPIFKNYFAGGPTSVRGYKSLSLGPRDSTGDPIGGNAKVLGNAELYFPSPIYADTMRFLTFFDAGSVFDTEGGKGFDTKEFRYSAGVGLAWLSPVGAITMSYAQPLKKDSQDEPEEFQFTFGTSF